MKIRRSLLGTVGILLIVLQPLTADVSVGTNLFAKGRSRVSLGLGSGQSFNETYTILGIGAGYYVFDGLEAGLGLQGWFGGGPSIYKVSPQLTYVFYQLERIKPYFGGFYRRTFYENTPDLDSSGARMGVYVPLNPQMYVGGGAVYEKYFNCDTAVYSTCSSWYPELTFAFAF